MTLQRRPHRPARLAAAVLTGVLGAAALAPSATARPAERFPDTIELPAGFQPEGIAISRRAPRAYTGALSDGDIYRINLRTGRGRVISEGPGTPSVGMKLRRRLLFVAGGTAGDARVVNTRTGEIVKEWQLGPAGSTFVNDVVLTRRAAWFTNSAAPVVYRVPLTRRGRPVRSDRVTSVPLGGAWEQGAGFGANGISTTPNRRRLLVINSTSGLLYRVHKRTGRATEVDLGGASLTNGDGLLRVGRTLYVVRNRLNLVAVLRLNRWGGVARYTDEITSPGFDVPTTVAPFRRWLYLPNARFTTPPTPDTRYTVTRVRAAGR